MSGDSIHRKSNSPQSSTEVSSLQVNRLKNKEALEKRLQCRPPIKELVNQGILLNPSISHPDKVRQLQRARTSDILRHKIEKRPDRQSLVNRRIIRDDRPGTSPFITEQCHNLEKYRLKTSLSSKLTTRPGSLELIEKGVLQVDPGVDSLIRCGSIQYPRVEAPACAEGSMLPIPQSIPTPPPLPSSINVSSLSTVSAGITVTSTVNTAVGAQRSTVAGKSQSSTGSSTSRSMKDETVISKYGSLVFHNYCPKSVDADNSVTSSTFLQKQKAREAQQADLLRLQDTALAHQLVQQELSARARLKQSRTDHPTDVCSTSPPSVSTSQPTPEPSNALSTSGSPYEPSTIDSQESPFYLNPNTPAESCSSHSGHSINWTNDYNSVSFAKENPVLSDNCLIPNYVCALEQLNKTQLRAECRERKLPRSGVKAALIRKLEPHRDEILSKYFPFHTSSSNASELSTTHSPSTHTISFQPKLSSATLATAPDALPQPPPPPPVWTAPMPSPNTMFTMSPSTWLPVATSHQTGIFLCSATPGVQSIMAPASLDTPNGTATLLVTSEPDLTINSTSALRHSSSAPFIANIPGTICGSLPSHNVSGTPTPVHMNSVPSTPLIPIKLETANLSSSSASSSHAIGMYLGMMQTPVISTATVSASKPTIFFAPNVLSLTQAENLLGGTTNTSGCVSSSSSMGTEVIFTSTGSSGPFTSFVTTGSFSPGSQSATHSAICTTSDGLHLTTGPPRTSQSNGSDSWMTMTSEGLPSLSQIENMWLRIRELRRILTKAQDRNGMNSSSSSTSDDSFRIHQLEQEHERLSTLFRLVIIERIDSLIELRDSGVSSFSSDSTHPSQATSNDLHVELNLMYSYLRKLSDGTIYVDNRDTSSICLRPRHSSSPLLDTTGFAAPSAVIKSNHLSTPYSTVNEKHMTSTPVYDAPSFKKCVTHDNHPCHATSWSDGVQTASLTRIHAPSTKPLGVTGTHDEVISDEPSEPPPSPMTTDVFFELWESVIKDTTRNGHNKTHCDTISGLPHCSSLPRNLGNGFCDLQLNTKNQQQAAHDVHGYAEHFAQIATTPHADEPDGGQLMDGIVGSSFHPEFPKQTATDQLRDAKTNDNDHEISFDVSSESQPTESFLHDAMYKPDCDNRQLTTPTAPPIACSPSAMIVDVDWSSLVSAPSLFPVYSKAASARRVHSCTGPQICSTCSSEVTALQQPAAIPTADSPHSLLLTALESDFHELMDTTDSIMGMSPLVMNWTGDA